MRPVANNRSLRTAAALGLAALVGACFNPPAAAVQFACDPAGAAACPAGYTCEADGCCHRDGSDYGPHAGECRLGGDASEGPATGATADASTASTGDASTGDATAGDATTGDATTATTGDASTATTGDASGATETSTGTQTTGAT